jgi:histone H3/H4
MHLLEGSSRRLAGIMEDYANDISKEAIKLASHAGRKTVKAADIKMAAEIVK